MYDVRSPSKFYNIWFSFYDLQEDESLIFFPESFKKDIKPNINQSYNLDPNKDNFEIHAKFITERRR